MRILLATFAECPENLHLERALISGLSGEKNAELDVVHDFLFPYQFIEKPPLPGGGRRVRCGSLRELKENLRGSYDLLIVLDFAKRRACSAPFLWLAKGLPCPRKIFIANHLVPMTGHNPTADMAKRLALMRGFDAVYMLESDDKDLWAGMGVRPEALRTRGYAVDCLYYRPGGAVQAGGTPYIFAAGSAGRDFPVLIRAAERVGTRVEIFSDGKAPAPPGKPRPPVGFFPLSKNLHDLRRAIQGAAVVAVPVADHQINEAAGNSIAFLAMACGRPVIARRTRYMERFIRDGVNGFFYDSLSSGNLVRQLERALSLGPPDLLELGRAARSVVLRKASLQVFAKEFVRTLMAQKRKVIAPGICRRAGE
jgi:glycosyltransferase involved in cell wall biosynthesis